MTKKQQKEWSSQPESSWKLLHWVSVQHALEVEVRLYDRLFSDDEAPQIKRKILRFCES
jgi:hypothetical protein